VHAWSRHEATSPWRYAGAGWREIYIQYQ